jgi:hypothetical protein
MQIYIDYVWRWLPFHSSSSGERAWSCSHWADRLWNWLVSSQKLFVFLKWFFCNSRTWALPYFCAQFNPTQSCTAQPHGLMYMIALQRVHTHETCVTCSELIHQLKVEAFVSIHGEKVWSMHACDRAVLIVSDLRGEENNAPLQWSCPYNVWYSKKKNCRGQTVEDDWFLSLQNK